MGSPTDTVDARTCTECPIHGSSGEEEWEEAEIITEAIDPSEPACHDGAEHDWQSPHALVGGLKENPGVWGNDGPGVRINEACVRCGCKKTTNTGAQRPDNGQRGLTSVSYTPDFYDLSKTV